jgi:hypothetical protein
MDFGKANIITVKTLNIKVKYIDSGIEEEETQRFFRNGHLCFGSVLKKLQGFVFWHDF